MSAYNKYGAKKTEIDGISFDSQREATRYRELKMLANSGLISDLRLQVPFELQPAFTAPSGEKIRAIRYYADFVYKDGRQTVVEDVKGMKTDVYQLKKKLLLFHFPDIVFREI